MKEPFRLSQLPKISEEERERQENENLNWARGIAEARSYAEAERVIAEGQGGGLWSLDLYAGDEFSEVPPHLANLTKLNHLGLHGNFRDLEPIYGLKDLQSLLISRNWNYGEEMSDLVGLEPLAGLHGLESLTIYARVLDLTPLAGLTRLSSLNLAGLEFVDLTPLAGLTRLTTLNLNGCEAYPEDLAALRPLMPSLIEGARWEGGGLHFEGTRIPESDPELARISGLSAYPQMLALREYLFPEDVPESSKPSTAAKTPEPPRSPALIEFTRGEHPKLAARPNPPSNGKTSPNPARLEGLLRRGQSLCKTLIAFGEGMNAGPGFRAALEGYGEEAGLGPEKVLPDTLEFSLDLAFTALDLRQDHPDSAMVRGELVKFRDGPHRELMEQHFPAMAEQEAAADASVLPPDLPVAQEVEDFARALKEGAEDDVSPESLARYASGARDLIEAEDASPEGRKDRKRALYGLAGVASSILKAVGVGSLATAVTVLADLKTLGALEPIVRAAQALWRVVKGFFGF